MNFVQMSECENNSLDEDAGTIKSTTLSKNNKKIKHWFKYAIFEHAKEAKDSLQNA